MPVSTAVTMPISRTSLTATTDPTRFRPSSMTCPYGSAGSRGNLVGALVLLERIHEVGADFFPHYLFWRTIHAMDLVLVVASPLPQGVIRLCLRTVPLIPTMHSALSSWPARPGSMRSHLIGPLLRSPPPLSLTRFLVTNTPWR